MPPSEVQFGESSPKSVADGGYGLEWEVGSAGVAVASIRVTSPTRAAEQWLHVQVIGQNLNQTMSLGPYDANAAVFSVPIDLGLEANDKGLVQVLVRLDVLDPTTRALTAARRSGPAYVLNAGTPSEEWLTEADAEARAIRPTAGIDSEEIVDGIVGFEVSP